MSRLLVTVVVPASCVSLAVFGLGAGPVRAQPGHISIERPGEHEFVKDLAGLLTETDKAKVRDIAGKLLKDKATPIIVVTINSMADHGGAGMRIETFARLLFDQWGIGHEKLNGELWNTGILFLVAKNDRKARIELGAGWKRDKDEAARRIMDELIIPRFKDNDYSAGIVAGVEGLDAMARERELPKGSRSGTWLPYLLLGGFVALAIFTIVSLIRRGSSGWAWLFWAAVFGVIGYMLYQMMHNQRSSGGGGFSGGSFGGGFSGGGGATGSW